MAGQKPTNENEIMQSASERGRANESIEGVGVDEKEQDIPRRVAVPVPRHPAVQVGGGSG